ncbi:MAG: tetratricopeptide repeat protein [Bacteroidota bacterium]
MRFFVILWALVLVEIGAGGTALQAQSRTDTPVPLPGTGLTQAATERLPELTGLVEATYRSAPDSALAHGHAALALLGTSPAAPSDEATRRQLLFRMGMAHYYLSAWDSVGAYADRLDALPATAGLAGADALLLRGMALRGQRFFEEAKAPLHSALARYEAVGEPARQATALYFLGVVHRSLREFEAVPGFYEQALSLWEEAGDQAWKATTLHSLGAFHRMRDAYDEARAFYDQALVLREALGDRRGLASSFNGLGLLYHDMDAYDEALTSYAEALALYEEIGDERRAANVLLSVGRVHRERGDYEEALSHLLRALAFYEATDNKRAMADPLSSIGNLYRNLQNYHEALRFLARALALREETGDTRLIAATLHNIGNVHYDRGDVGAALDFYRRSLALKEELDKPSTTAITLQSIGTVLRVQGELEEAQVHYARALTLYEEIGNPGGEARVLGTMAQLYLEQGRPGEALAANDQTLAMALEMKAAPLIARTYGQRADILEAQGRYAEALSAYRTYKAAQDSLFNSESQSVVAELQQQYRAQEQQQRIELLESRRAQQRLWIGGLLGGLVLLGLIVALLFGRMRLRRRALEAIQAERRKTEKKAAQLAEQAAELERANELKSHFLANISHEFRTPLTLTFGPLDDLAQGRFASLDEARPHIERARRNGHRLLRLINQLLDLSKLDAGALLLHPRRHDLARHLREIAALFESIAQQRQIHYTVAVSETLVEHVFDADKIEKVVVNLLSNAFKFTPAGGKVSLTLARLDGGTAQIVVADTGPGIAEEHLPHLFDRFYQVERAATRSHEGSGIGLALVKEVVELHGGTVQVESTVGFGTRFLIDLPLLPDPSGDAMPVDVFEPSPSAYEDRVLPPVDALPVLPERNGEPIDAPADAAMVLVIEDNADMRAYIRAHLEDAFVVAEADNGRSGVERALDLVPDLVLSDVMMPEMDGFAVCQTLKMDTRTSHIPVVLLTAKADVAHRIAGYEQGADGYLAKPFNAEELVVRVRTLIAERQRLRARFAGLRAEAQAAEAAPVWPPREAAFLEAMTEAMQDQLADAGFGVDQLADALSMSRRQLDRKVQALLGETPAALLRHERLAAAAALLDEDRLSVKEISHAVGFRSLSSFSKAFRKAYGVAPSAYTAVRTDAAAS